MLHQRSGNCPWSVEYLSLKTLTGLLIESPGEYEKQKGEPDGKSIRPRRDSSGEKSLLAITESESSRDNYNGSSVGSQFAAVSLNDPPSRGSAGRRNSTQSSGQLDSSIDKHPHLLTIGLTINRLSNLSRAGLQSIQS